MATNSIIGVRPERFMGMAEEVPRPALPSPNGVPPAGVAGAGPQGPGAANLNGSGSKPIGDGQGPQGGSQRFGPGNPTNAAMNGLRNALPAVRTAVNTGGGAIGGALRGALPATAIASAVGSFNTPTEEFAQRMGVQPESTLGELGVRAAGTLGDLGNAVTFGVADRVGNLIAGNGFNRSATGAPAPAAAPVAPAAAAPAVAAPVAAPAAPAGLAGTPLFGAPDGVRKVAQPGANPLYTNATTDAADAAFQGSKGTVSTVGGGPEVMASLRRAGDLQAEISKMRAGLADRGDTGAYLRNSAQVASLAPGGLSEDMQAQIKAITGGAGRKLTAAGAQAVNNVISQGQNNERGYAEIAERARSADQQAGVAQRGQDVTEAGQVRQQQTAQLAAQRAQQNSNRDFGLRAAEFGQRQNEFSNKQEQEAFSMREKATAGLADRYAKQFTTTDKDGKSIVDTARVGKFTNGVQTFLGNRQAELAAKIQAGQATPEEVRAHKEIATKGVAALDEQDLAHIESQMKLGERSEQTANILQGTRYVQSSNPADYEVVGRKQNLVGSDTLSLRGGGSIRENDTKYTEGGNLVFPNRLKQRTNDFDQAKGLRK